MDELRHALSRLRLGHLRLLALLAEEGTLRRAAVRMHVSQPAVSQMVKEIESAFRGPLFERTRRGVVPNRRLDVLLRRSRIALGELIAADVELQRVEIPQPRLRIGANLHLLTHLLPNAITRLREGQPYIRIEIREGSTTRLLDDLLAGALDCGL